MQKNVMDQLEQRYVLENQMVGGKLNQKEQEYTPALFISHLMYLVLDEHIQTIYHYVLNVFLLYRKYHALLVMINLHQLQSLHLKNATAVITSFYILLLLHL